MITYFVVKSRQITKGHAEKLSFNCNLQTLAANASDLLTVSLSDTASSALQRFRAKFANFVMKYSFSACPKLMSSLKNIKETSSKRPQIPNNIQIGDFVVAKFKSSSWADYLPWEDWHHVGMVSQLEPLKIIEVSGILLQKKDKKYNKEEVREGVVEYEMGKKRIVTLLDGTKNSNANLWLLDDLIETAWLKPVFPNPIREIDKWYKPRILRKIITEKEARKRAVAYAQKQLGEPYDIATSKWNESKWYCSLLIYKSYSQTVTGMYLETYGRSYDIKAGPMVTPEDLVDSPRSHIYFTWKKEV